MPSNLHLCKDNSPDQIIIKCAVKHLELVINLHTGISGAPDIIQFQLLPPHLGPCQLVAGQRVMCLVSLVSAKCQVIDSLWHRQDKYFSSLWKYFF